MRLPTHISLSIRHNPHAGDYRSIEDWLVDEQVIERYIEPEDEAAIRESGEVWVVSWCPRTPVASNCVAAATLDRVLELARAAQPEPPNEVVDIEERLKLLRAASRPSEALEMHPYADAPSFRVPSAQGHILSAITQLERRRAELLGNEAIARLLRSPEDVPR